MEKRGEGGERGGIQIKKNMIFKGTMLGELFVPTRERLRSSHERVGPPGVRGRDGSFQTPPEAKFFQIIHI
jgi:hypothetical protein